MLSRAILRLLSPITTTNSTIFKCLCSSWAAIHPDNHHNAATTSSEVYRDARKYARPSTVTWSMRLHNSVCLIGTVKFLPKKYSTKNGRFGVFTCLLVNTSPLSLSSFWITLEMWDELAERALLHLKPEDYIYISGELGTYTTISEGVEKTRYKVIAKELNYVKLEEPGKSSLNSQKETREYVGKSSSQNYCNRLQLWQILFANPEEWYDNRKHKKNPRQPDFKHKTTKEVLWLQKNDPPWIHKQVELLDSKIHGSFNDSTSRYLSYELLSDEHSAETNPTSSTIDWKVFK